MIAQEHRFQSRYPTFRSNGGKYPYVFMDIIRSLPNQGDKRALLNDLEACSVPDSEKSLV